MASTEIGIRPAEIVKELALIQAQGEMSNVPQAKIDAAKQRASDMMHGKP